MMKEHHMFFGPIFDWFRPDDWHHPHHPGYWDRWHHWHRPW
jgi:hypothetical protein